MGNYEAKNHYCNSGTAARYERQFSSVISINNLRVKLVGWGEQRAFMQMLRQVSGAKTALDIACGTGRYTKLLLDNGYRTSGIDISEEMLAFAQKRVGKHNNLSFLHQGDAENLLFEDKQFDLITCMRLYHRIPSKIRNRMLSEIKRVGRGQAILFFGMTTPILELRRSLREGLIPSRSSNPYPLTQQQLSEALGHLGLDIHDTAWVLPFLAEGQIVLVKW